MAGAGFKIWATGNVVTAADFNTYVQEQIVGVFADSSARSTAISSPSEGMISYLSDTDKLYQYDGSSWSEVAPTVSGGATLVGKTSAETVNNSTTLQDDDTLKFTGAADTNYAIMGVFRYQSIESADFKWAITAAGSSTIDLGAVYYNIAGSTTTTNAAWTFLAEDASVSTVGFGATAPYVASFFMGTVLMDGTGGEVAVQWAQHSAVASNTQMLPGAWIRYEAI